MSQALQDRFRRQLHFLAEIDKMKTILRQTILIDRSRQENDAEHSWHIAVMAMILQEYAAGTGSDDNRDNAPPDMARVLKMTLVHDIIEVDAGDTFAYDEEALKTKTAREAQAADRVFSLLPDDQAVEVRALWEEFEAMETRESRYANAVDRLQPFMNNSCTDGHTWRTGSVRAAQVYKRMDIIRHMIPAAWPFIEETIADALRKGYLTE